MSDRDSARTAGAFLRAQAIRDAKALGPGTIARANVKKRKEWGMHAGGDADELAAFVLALGLDPVAWSARAARFESGPVAEFMKLARRAKERRRENRLPKALSSARARTWLADAQFDSNEFERLESLRFDRPRSALKATYRALGAAQGPTCVGRILCVHACTLRECDELADALLALWIALPVLDLADDVWGLGRALASASAVARACGKFELARGLIDEAECWYLRARSRSGRGMAMVVRGALLLASGGDPGDALRELDAAGGLLSGSSRRRIASIHQVRAAALLKLEDLTGACEAIRIAQAKCPDAAMMRGRIAWHAAEIESASGNDAEAAALFRQAYRLISEPLCDRLLVAAQALRSIVRSGDVRGAAAHAELLLGPLFSTLDSSEPEPMKEVLAGAHRDLYRAALQSSLTATVLDGSLSNIEKVRTARIKLRLKQVLD